jgi:transcriptional regulator with XRE-family HTH domain
MEAPAMLTAEEVAKLIRRTAMEKGISQSDLAIEMGIYKSHLSMMLNGQRGYNKQVLDYLGLEEVVLYQEQEGSSQKVDPGNEKLICS